MSDILAAAAILFSVQGFFLAVLGFLIGCVGGAMVGIGGGLTTALVIPFTLSMPAEHAMIILIGVYSGVSYAGSIPAILINTPGSPGSAAVTMDGYAMARQGEGATAIAISATASAIGAVVGGLCFIAALPVMAEVASAFGSQEFLMFAVFGLCSIVAASSSGIINGFIAGILGALFASVGANMLDANPRFTLGIGELYDGFDLVAVMIGLFAFAEMIRISKVRTAISSHLSKRGSRWKGVMITIREWAAVLRGSAIGIGVGLIPGEGSTVATFMSYITERQVGRNPELFGKGHPAGIAGPEAANNAVISGALVPTLSFGIPGSVATALLLTALMLQGIRPGPQFLQQETLILYTIIGAILLGGMLTMVIGLTMAGPLALLTVIPVPVLVPVVSVISVIGVFAANFTMAHVFMALGAGALGYAFIRFDYPIIAFLLGFIVGPLAEENFMRSYQITDERIWGIFERPICAALLVASLLVLIRPVRRALLERKKREQSPTQTETPG